MDIAFIVIGVAMLALLVAMLWLWLKKAEH